MMNINISMVMLIWLLGLCLSSVVVGKAHGFESFLKNHRKRQVTTTTTTIQEKQEAPRLPSVSALRVQHLFRGDFLLNEGEDDDNHQLEQKGQTKEDPSSSPPLTHSSVSSLSDDIKDFIPADASNNNSLTHFMFLVHGLRGLSTDLSYLQTVLRELARQEKDNSQMKQQELVVHSAVCNEYKTTDGVRKGGDRLVEEMRQVIYKEMAKRGLRRFPDDHEITSSDTKDLPNITISIWGNSMGGLFGRYAIAQLVRQYCTTEENESSTNNNNDGGGGTLILDGRFRLHLNVFCTTATPHLGVSRHTYLPMPKTAEKYVAKALGDTGRDLFRLNDLLHTMATSSDYLQPLGQFRKRVAYANAYATDFPVPASTAAFLSANSTYPHYFQDQLLVEPPPAQTSSSSSSSSFADDNKENTNNNKNKNKNNNENEWIIATLHTYRRPPNQEQEEGLPNQQPMTLQEQEVSDDSSNAIVVNEGDDDDEKRGDDKSFLASSVSSLTSFFLGNSTTKRTNSQLEEYIMDEDEQELHNMSMSLDELGWKKVFVDMRQAGLPTVKFPRLSLWSSSSSSSNASTKTKSKMRQQLSVSRLVVPSSTSNNNNDHSTTPSHRNHLKHHQHPHRHDHPVVSDITNSHPYDDENDVSEKDGLILATRSTIDEDDNDMMTVPSCLKTLSQRQSMVASKDVATAVLNPTDNRVALPLGHDMMAAISRSPIRTYINKGGRPVVDALAKELVQDIFHWYKEHEKNEADIDIPQPKQ